MLNNLTVKNLATHHLEDINIDIASGHTLGITGVSGCGKSILLHAIADVIPHRGEMSLDGELATAMEPHLWRKRVGLLTTNSYWWKPLVADHFPNRNLEEDENDDDFVALGLDFSLYHSEVAQCSTGELQRLAIIRLLNNQPRVLLLDEPTANLDENNRYRVEQLVKHYQQQHNVPIIWVSHDIEQLQRMTEYYYILNDGQLNEGELCTN